MKTEHIPSMIKSFDDEMDEIHLVMERMLIFLSLFLSSLWIYRKTFLVPHFSTLVQKMGNTVTFLATIKMSI